MTITQSDEDTRDGRHRFGHALGTIAVSTGIIIGIIAVDVYVSTIVAVLLGFLYPIAMIAAFTVRPDAIRNREFRKDEGGWVAIMAIAALLAYLAGTDLRHNLILRSGTDVTAVVLEEKIEKSGRGVTRSYTLIPSDGAAIPGGDLTPNSERFKPGDIITVRVDPAGRVAPKLPGEADSPVALLGFLGLNAAIDGIVLWAARKPRPPRLPSPTRQRLAERWRRARDRFRALTGWPFVVAAGVLSAAWLGLFRLALSDLTRTITAGVAYLFVMSGFFGMFDDDRAKNVFRGRVVLTVALATVALGGYLCATT
ncbi:hypothetical protein ACGF12_06380 [Kitasatospora sp. NPDC048296]|uniref:hypothetical protein n=1 Tax=Kitasatospora sp. NPDC048296 TaxID=3364048 RepID=UPI0037157353